MRAKRFNLSSEDLYTIWWVSGGYCRHNMLSVINYVHPGRCFWKVYVNKLDKEKHPLHPVQRKKTMQIEVLSFYLSFLAICGTLGWTLIFLQVMLLCASSCKLCIKYWSKVIFSLIHRAKFQRFTHETPGFHTLCCVDILHYQNSVYLKNVLLQANKKSWLLFASYMLITGRCCFNL